MGWSVTVTVDQDDLVALRAAEADIRSRIARWERSATPDQVDRWREHAGRLRILRLQLRYERAVEAGAPPPPAPEPRPAEGDAAG